MRSIPAVLSRNKVARLVNASAPSQFPKATGASRAATGGAGTTSSRSWGARKFRSRLKQSTTSSDKNEGGVGSESHAGAGTSCAKELEGMVVVERSKDTGAVVVASSSALQKISEKDVGNGASNSKSQASWS